jgi:hypothetical protein
MLPVVDRPSLGTIAAIVERQMGEAEVIHGWKGAVIMASWITIILAYIIIAAAVFDIVRAESHLLY